MRVDRKKILGRVKRVVVKLGTSSITKDRGLGLDPGRLKTVCSQIHALCEAGVEVVVVSSGAIAAGMDALGHKRRSRDVRVLQALASVGQAALMRAYIETLGKFNLVAGQVLLTKSDFESRERYLNARNTMLTLFREGVVPVVNENDTVSVEEIKVGDNDNLAALTACCIEADLLIMLSDIEGVYTCDPNRNRDAQFISVVSDMHGDLCDVSGKSSHKGVGGLKTKLEAASRVTGMGIPMVLSNSARKNVILDILAGDDVGTLFIPEKGLDDRRHWIKFTAKSRGKIIVDDGARKVLVKGSGSLLPVGVSGVKGLFEKGDTVDIAGPSGRVFARAVTNYSSLEVNKIKGLESREIEKKLGYRRHREVVFRDNMVLL